jgi:hypothetical protein
MKTKRQQLLLLFSSIILTYLTAFANRKIEYDSELRDLSNRIYYPPLPLQGGEAYCAMQLNF